MKTSEKTQHSTGSTKKVEHVGPGQIFPAVEKNFKSMKGKGNGYDYFMCEPRHF